MPTKEFSYPKYIGERIRSGRLNLDLSQEQLAEAVGLGRPAISQIESGKRAVDSIELVSFAKVLQKPLSFFVEPEEKGTMDDEPVTVLYRADDISERDRAFLDDFKLICQDYAVLEELLDLKSLEQFPTWHHDVNSKWEAVVQGENIATKLRSACSLGSAPLKNLSSTIEGMGVKVIERKLPESKAWGFSVTSPEWGNCIFVNTACSKVRQRFTLAHELGHLVLDRNHLATIYSESHTPDRDVDNHNMQLLEVRANAFAASFLMPSTAIKDSLSKTGASQTSPGSITTFMVEYLAGLYGVSYQAMLWRLVNVHVIDKKQKEQFSNYGRTNETREKEEEHEEWLPERFRTLALEAYRRMRISIGKLSDYLRIDIHEARKVVQRHGIKQSLA